MWMNCWWMSFVCLLSFVFTTQIEFRECCIWFQCSTQRCCSSVFDFVDCLFTPSKQNKTLMVIICESSSFGYHIQGQGLQWLCSFSVLLPELLLFHLRGSLSIVPQTKAPSMTRSSVMFVFRLVPMQTQANRREYFVDFQHISQNPNIIGCGFCVNKKECAVSIIRVCFRSFLLTIHVKFSECRVCHQWLTQCCCSWIANKDACCSCVKKKTPVSICQPFEQPKWRARRVVFVFNASLTAIAPTSPNVAVNQSFPRKSPFCSNHSCHSVLTPSITTTHTEFCKCFVDFQCFSKCNCSRISDKIIYWLGVHERSSSDTDSRKEFVITP